MLDVYYPSLRAFMRACRNARAYVAQHPDPMLGDVSAYDPRAILKARKMVILNNGEIVCPAFFFLMGPAMTRSEYTANIALSTTAHPVARVGRHALSPSRAVRVTVKRRGLFARLFGF